jgi:hypothetical protein
MPGRDLSEPYLAAQLAARGMYAQQARNTALAVFASDLPAPVIADLLGMRIYTAVTWGAHYEARLVLLRSGQNLRAASRLRNSGSRQVKRECPIMRGAEGDLELWVRTSCRHRGP